MSVLDCYSSSALLPFCDLSISFLHIMNLHSAFYFFSFLLFYISFSSKIKLVVILMLVVDAPLKMKRVTKSSVSESVLKVIRLNPLSAFAAF